MRPLATRLGFMAVFVAAFAVLLPGVAPHVTAGDAAELALSGATLGIAHPPGYPVYALVQRAGAELVPFGNAAFRQNVLSAVVLSLSLVLLGMLIVRLTGQRWTLVLPCALLSAPLFRHAAHTADVFPLTFLTASLIVLAAVAASKKPAGGPFLGFLFGVAVGVQQTLLLLVPAAAFYFLRHQPAPGRSARRLALPVAAAFAAGFSIHLYLPIRSFAAPALDWGDPQTLGRLWDVVTRARHGFLRLSDAAAGPGLSLGAFRDALAHARGFVLENLGVTGGLMVIFGSLHSLARRYHRRTMIAAWLLILFTGPIFFWFAGVPYRPGGGTLDRFALVPMVGAVILMALGLAPLWTSGLRLYRGFMLAALAAFILEAGALRLDPAPGLRREGSVREAGLNMLRSAPKDAVLFADRADEAELVLAFLLKGEDRRGDIRFIDCNAGVTPSIYGDGYYRTWGAPRLRARERVETAVLSGSTRPVVYATADPAMIDVYRTQRGLLYRAWPLDRAPAPTAVPWHLVLSWRYEPVEPRARAFARRNFDMLGRALFETNHRDAAVQVFGLAQRAGGPNRWEQMAVWLHRRGEPSKAAAAYEKAAAAAVESENFLIHYGQFLAERGRVIPAIETYEKGVALYPESPRLLYNLAVARWETGAVGEARALLERVLAIEPWNVDAQRLMTRKSDGNRI